MVTLERLSDGCYRLTLEYRMDGNYIRRVWTFRETEPQIDAKPVPNAGNTFCFRLAGEQPDDR